MTCNMLNILLDVFDIYNPNVLRLCPAEQLYLWVVSYHSNRFVLAFLLPFLIQRFLNLSFNFYNINKNINFSYYYVKNF